jgi:hypothetical protein
MVDHGYLPRVVNCGVGRPTRMPIDIEQVRLQPERFEQG